MIPQTLILRNFMCYREDVPELKLDGIEIACLSGDNGAGKSALLDAITWVLWGRARMSDDELVAMGASEMAVDLRFELSGQDYRVIRTYQRGKKTGKSTLDLQMRNGVGWKPLGEQQIRHTEERIIELLRMRYDTFINSAFLLQGRADEFTRKAPGERKQVLADILELSEYARLEARAKERVKELEGKIKGVTSVIEHLQHEADKRAFYVESRDKAQVRVDDLEAALKAATARLEAARERVQLLNDKRRQRAERQEQLGKLQSEQVEQGQQAVKLRDSIITAENTLARRAEIEAGVAELNAARSDLERLESLRDRYEELEGQRRELQETLRQEKSRLESDLRQARSQLGHLQARVVQRDLLGKEIDDIEQKLVALAPLADQREQIEQERADLDERISRQHELRMRREQLTKQIEKRQDSLIGTREAKRELLQRLDQQLAAETGWQADLAVAREQQSLLVEEEQQLAGLRVGDHEQSEHVIELRAHCQSIKAQADSLKERKALLTPDEAVCPVCGNELGQHGVAQVLDHYEVEIQDLRTRYRDCKKEADAGDAQLKQNRAALVVLEQQIDKRRQSVARIDSLEAQLAQAVAWRTERESVQADLESVSQQIAAKDFDQVAQAELRDVDATLAALGADTAALTQQRKVLATQLSALERQLREQGQLEGMLVARRAELVSADKELAALPEAEARVQELARVIEQNDYAQSVRAEGKQIVAQIQELGYTREAQEQARLAVRDLLPWQEEQQQLASAQQQIELNRFRLADLEANIARRNEEIAALQAQIVALDEALLALRSAETDQREAITAEERQRRELSVAQKILGENESDLRKAEEAAAQVLERDSERRCLLERQSVFDELAQAYGKKGVQAMLIETAIPEIEREANSLLGRMTDNQMHIAVETQRTTKKDDLQETLEIKIADALGTRAYDAFSGGESFRVDFAIRIALSKLLARRAGARLETLVIDEGFGALDARGRERLVDAISSVRPDFRRILVITHIQELKDLFPTQIEITKTPEGSRWEVV